MAADSDVRMIDVLIIMLAASLLGGAAAVALSTRIRDEFAAWLRAQGLSRSSLMAAVVLLERVGTVVRLAFRARTISGPVKFVSERVLTLEEIDLPEVRAALLARGRVEFSALPYLEQ